MEHGQESTETGVRLTGEQLRYYLQITGLKQKMTDAEIDRFIAFADEFVLNPYKREIHCYFDGDGERRTAYIICGYEVYIKRAERTGKLDGWSVTVEGDGNDMKALVEIHRKDWSNPFRHEVYFGEVAQKNDTGELTPFWKKMPRFQLKKTAISQAFRWAFSDELGGLPYEAAELPIKGSSLPPNINPEQDRKMLGDAKASTVTVSQDIDPIRALEAYLKANEETLTKKHCEWIESKLKDEHTDAKARLLLSYAQKYVRDQLAREQGQPANRASQSRYYRPRPTPRIPAIAQNAVHPAH